MNCSELLHEKAEKTRPHPAPLTPLRRWPGSWLSVSLDGSGGCISWDLTNLHQKALSPGCPAATS